MNIEKYNKNIKSMDLSENKMTSQIGGNTDIERLAIYKAWDKFMSTDLYKSATERDERIRRFNVFFKSSRIITSEDINDANKIRDMSLEKREEFEGVVELAEAAEAAKAAKYEPVSETFEQELREDLKSNIPVNKEYEKTLLYFEHLLQSDIDVMNNILDFILKNDSDDIMEYPKIEKNSGLPNYFPFIFNSLMNLYLKNKSKNVLSKIIWNYLYINDYIINFLGKALCIGLNCSSIDLSDNPQITNSSISPAFFFGLIQSRVYELKLTGTSVDKNTKRKIASILAWNAINRLQDFSKNLIYEINWTDSEMSDTLLDPLKDMLCGNPFLLKINLSNNLEITDDVFSLKFLDCIDNSSLVTLILYNTSVTIQKKKEIVKYLVNNCIKELTESKFIYLDWKFHELDDNEFNKFLTALDTFKNTSLQNIYLTGNNITDKYISLLVEIIRQTGITFVDLSLTYVTNDMHKLVLNTCVDNAARLLQEQKIDNLYLGCQYFSRLKDIVCITDDHVRILCDALQTNTSLRHLHINGNIRVTDKSGNLLLEVLSKTHICSLRVNNTVITPEIQSQITYQCVQNATPLLKKNDSSLKKLYWSGCNITDKMIEELINALPDNTNLEEIHVNGNPSISSESKMKLFSIAVHRTINV